MSPDDAPAPDPTGQLRPPPAPSSSPSPARIGGDRCPNCDAPRQPDGEFCEVCGLDFTTGKLPEAPPPPAPASVASGWVAVVEADRTMWESMQTENPGAAVAFPGDEGARTIELAGDTALIGRRSDSGAVFPDIDLRDPGVSRKHATLHRQADGSWSVRDEGSTNGTRVNDGADPIAAGGLVPLADGDRLHVGAFTRITIRRAG